jgi:hypothetical protein
LKHHYRSYEFLRQVYGSSTGECNVWRTMHLPQTTLQRLLQQGTNETAEFGISSALQKMQDQDQENGVYYRTSSSGEVEKDVNPFTTRLSKTLSEIADIVAGPSDYEENDYNLLNAMNGQSSDSAELLQTQISGFSHLSSGSGPGRTSALVKKTTFDDASWPILLEAMLGPGISKTSVLSPTAASAGGEFRSPGANRFSTPATTSAGQVPDNFNKRRPSLPTSPTGGATISSTVAAEKSHEKYDDDRNNSNLNSPESMVSPTSLSSDTSKGGECAKNNEAKFSIPRASLDLRVSNFLAPRHKGSDVATRYHKNDKQFLSKKDQRELMQMIVMTT